MDDDHFPIDDRLAGKIEGTGNHRKALRPVQPVAGVDLLAAAVDVNLDAVTVELDLMKRLVALRRLGLQCCKLGLNEPRHGWVRLGNNSTHKKARLKGKP